MFRRNSSGRDGAFGVYSISASRVFTVYPRQIKETINASDKSWLDSIPSVGTIPAKLILASFVHHPSLRAITTTVVAAVQTILIGIDDLVMDNPFVEYDAVRGSGLVPILLAPKVDFKQAKLDRIHVKVAPSAEVSKRGGLLACVLIPITREESDAFQRNFPDRKDYTDKSFVDPQDSFTFAQLQQFPNVVIRDAVQEVSITHRASGFQSMKHAFGTPFRPSYDHPGKTHGGPVLYKFCIGYSDLASYRARPSERFRPEESTFTVTFSSTLHLSEAGMTWIRPQPYLAQDPNHLAVTTPQSYGTIICQTPISNILPTPNGIRYVVIPPEVRPIYSPDPSDQASSSNQV